MRRRDPGGLHRGRCALPGWFDIPPLAKASRGRVLRADGLTATLMNEACRVPMLLLMDNGRLFMVYQRFMMIYLSKCVAKVQSKRLQDKGCPLKAIQGEPAPVTLIAITEKDRAGRG